MPTPALPYDFPLDRLRSAWAAAFGDPRGRRWSWATAPGRVNLIGEHTDYNGGFVLPAAIHLQTRVLAAARADSVVRVRADNLGETATFDLGTPDRDALPPWARYVAGPAWTLCEAGLSPAGVDAVVWGDVPLGGGLSSSASLEVAFVALWDRLGGFGLAPLRLAELAQQAERECVGVPCGIMDQLAAAACPAGHALLLDCASRQWRPVPLPPAWRIVVCDTGVRHALATSEYARRQEECARGVSAVQRLRPEVRWLRDVDEALLEAARAEMDELAWRRCRYVLAENARTLACADALAAGEPGPVRELMAASHAGLRDEYEVSCPELDRAVELAATLPGLVGARMTGGGFGGCTVNLVEADRAEAFAATLGERYRAWSGGQGGALLLRPGGGATAGELPA